MKNTKDALKKNGFLFELVNNDKPIHTAKEDGDYTPVTIIRNGIILL